MIILNGCNLTLFKKIKLRFKPKMYLFASRLNIQLNKFVSWQPNPHASAVDAFSLDWSNYLSYIFAPLINFSMLPRVLFKIEEHKAETVLVAPFCQAGSKMVRQTSKIVNRATSINTKGKKRLTLPFDKERIHPLWRKHISIL